MSHFRASGEEGRPATEEAGCEEVGRGVLPRSHG